MPEERRIALARVDGEKPQIRGGAALHVTVRRLHRGQARQDAVEQRVLVLSRHDRVRRIVLRAQPGRVDRVEDRQVPLVALGELGIEPQPVLVVVLHDEHHPGRLRVAHERAQRVDDPAERRLGIQPGAVLSREDAAVPPSQLRGQGDHAPRRLHLAGAIAGVRLREVGRVAEHGHLQATVGQRLPDLLHVCRVERGEEARVQLDPVQVELAGQLEPLEERHPALDEGGEEALGERRQRRQRYFLSAPIVTL